MAIYLRHVKPDGVIVFQATNRYVDIAPVVERLAASFGWRAVLVSDSPDASERERFRVSGSAQIIVTHKPGAARGGAHRLGGRAAPRAAPLPGVDRRFSQSP